MTRVRSRTEARLITGSLRVLAAHGLPIVVADRGSPDTFLATVQRIDGVTLVRPQGIGLVGQIVASLKAAARTGRPFILYTEPDKHDFFAGELSTFIRRAVGRPRGIVLASRSAAAFRTFPAVQRGPEAVANDLCRHIIGLPVDYFYGPFLMSRDLVAVLVRMPRNLGWGWRPHAFVTASRRSHSITACIGNYRCPVAQRGEGDRTAANYRARQFYENVTGVVSALDLVS
jgi:hypothetical protein